MEPRAHTCGSRGAMGGWALLTHPALGLSPCIYFFQCNHVTRAFSPLLLSFSVNVAVMSVLNPIVRLGLNVLNLHKLLER